MPYIPIIRLSKSFSSYITHPIPWFTSGIITGITLHNIIPIVSTIPSLLWYSIGCLLFVSLGLLFTRYAKKPILFFILGTITGFLCISYQISTYQKKHTALCQKFSNVTAQIIDITEHKTKRLPYKTSLYILSTQSERQKKHAPYSHTYIDVFTYKPLGDIDDIITLADISILPPTNYQYKKWLIKETVHATLFLPYVKHKTLKKQPSIRRTIHAIRDNLISSVEQKTNHITSMLFAALFLGNRWQYKKMYEKFNLKCKHIGISHLLARSGLHLAICISLWTYLFLFFPYLAGLQTILLLFLVFLYTIFSWTSISFYRAFFVYLYTQLHIFSYKKPHPLHMITIITLLFLLTNPMQLYFLDFQLSFSLTGILSIHSFLLRSQTQVN